MAKYDWRTVSAYRLPESVLDEFLTTVFGEQKFYITASMLLLLYNDE